ncbi:MAG TPA: hypothetical protein VK348_03755, partial [Planctomycetota bacterium]|nr:hypothetical protein [Planctomycetota bacterium]
PFLGLPPAVDDACTGFPHLLSETAIFADLATLRPKAGIAQFTVNQPLWSDGATKLRWIAVSNDGSPYGADERITVDHERAWRFPRGTMFIKQFAMPHDLRHPDGAQRRLETRLLAVRQGGEVYGVTYRWRPDGSDAELLTDGASDDIAVIDEQGKPATIAWTYPSPSQCITCHTAESGGVLGVNTRQLNRPATVGGTNQLVLLATHEWLDRSVTAGATAALPRLRALDDPDADLPTRIRSYLDANCASCHQPGSRVGDGAFGIDLRFLTPLERQGLIDAKAHNALGIAQGKVIVPGHPEWSVLLDRVARRGDPFAMPPLASGRADPVLLAQLRLWIEALPDPR